VKAGSVKELIEAVRRSVELFRWAARHYGLEVNFKAGKSEAIMQLRGKGKLAQLRRWAAPAGGMGIDIEGDDGECDILRVVPVYKHLGCLQAAGGNLTREFARRAKSASSMAAALMPFFRDRTVARKIRTMVALATIDAVMLSAAGWWCQVQQHQWRMLSASRMRALRAIAGLIGGPEAPTDAEVCAGLGVPTLKAKFRALRLGYFGRLLRHGPPQLTAVLSTVAAEPWWKEVQDDLAELRGIADRKLDDMPDPRAGSGMRAWVELARDFPPAWRSLTKLLGEQPTEASSEQQHELPSFACDRCEATFCSHHGLQSHRANFHGIGRWYRAYVDGTGLCPACGSNFFSRSRCIAHLRRAHRCLDFLRANPALELDHGTLHEAAVAERRAKRLAREAGIAQDFASRPFERPSQQEEQQCHSSD